MLTELPSMNASRGFGHGITPRARPRKEPAVRLIIVYKFVRATAALAASALLVAFTAAGRTASLNEAVMLLRHHVTSAWSIEVADALVRAMVPRHLWILAAALALDGASTFVEGWSLQRGWWWGPWLVVVATGAFVPFEVLALVHRVALGRVFLLGMNLLVAVYLGRRALRRGRLVRALDQKQGDSHAPSTPSST